MLGTGTSGLVVVSVELQHEIEQFLYDEANLLDERRFEEWLEVLADDIRYWAPLRTNRLQREIDRENTAAGELALFDDDKTSLTQRVRRLQTGMAWAEDPPSRTRHLVSNVRVMPTDSGDEFVVGCAYLLYRSRLEREVNIFVGSRSDRLRRVPRGAGWEIASRQILIDQATIDAKNLSVLF